MLNTKKTSNKDVKSRQTAGKKIKLLVVLATISTSLFSQGNWVQQDLLSSGYDFNHWVQFVDAVDSNVCWGLSADRNNATGAIQEYVRTVDGGNTWSFGTITNAANCAPSSIMALNADTAWVAMWNTTGGGRILRTNDGGASWVHQSTAAFAAPAGFPNIVHFFDANNGICMGDPNAGYFEIYTTTDGGTNWVRTPQANIATQQAGEFGITDVFTAQGTGTLWFGTNQGRFYKTTDAGLNWTAAASPYLGFIGGLAFKDANYGLACESDLGTVNTDLIVTTDGGTTWNILNTTTGNMAQKQSITYVPGSDSTFVITTPYNNVAGPLRDFGSAFSTNNGNDWYVVSQNLEVFSDNDFASANGGWSGGLTQLPARDPVMFKWTGPLFIPGDDAASNSIDVAANAGNATSNPKATFLNNGLNTNTFNVTMTITGGYSSTKTITALAFNQTQQVTFDPWTPATTGAYTVTVYTSLTGDILNSNDTLVKSINVYPEFLNYGWLSRQQTPLASFGLASAFSYTGVYPNDTGFVYTAGGSDFAAVVTTQNVFDVINDTWSTGSPMPTGKYQFSLNSANGKIIAAGGYVTGFTPDASTYIYDPATGIWTTGSPMPTPVGDYASGVYKDSLVYYIGGFDGASDQNIVQIYNAYTDNWTVGTTKTGTASAGLRGGIYQNKIVVACGFNQLIGGQIDEAHLGTIDAANPTNITWTTLPNYPGGTAGRLAAGTTFGGTIPLVVFVGGDPDGLGTSTLDGVWGYDLAQNIWKIGPAKPTAVSNISNFVGSIFNDSLYLVSISGYDGAALSLANEWFNMGPADTLLLGIKNLANQNSNSLIAYPNPTASGIVNIISPEKSQKYTLEIFNAFGQKVYSNKFENSPKIKVDLSNQAKGIYFVQLKSETKIYSVKIVLD